GQDPDDGQHDQQLHECETRPQVRHAAGTRGTLIRPRRMAVRTHRLPDPGMTEGHGNYSQLSTLSLFTPPLGPTLGSSVARPSGPKDQIMMERDSSLSFGL